MSLGRGRVWALAPLCLFMFGIILHPVVEGCSTMGGAPACELTATTYLSQEDCLSYLASCTTSLIATGGARLWIDVPTDVVIPSDAIPVDLISVDPTFAHTLTIEATTMEEITVGDPLFHSSDSETTTDFQCTGLYFPNLINARYVKIDSELPAITSLDFPALTTTYCFRVERMSSVTAINLPVFTTINQQFQVINLPSLVNLNITHSDSLAPAGGYDYFKFVLAGLPLITAVRFPNFNASYTSFSLDRMAGLQIVDFGRLEHVNMFDISRSPMLAQLNLSSLATANYLDVDTGSLSALSLPSLRSTNRIQVTSRTPLASIDTPSLISADTFIWQGTCSMPTQPFFSTYLPIDISWIGIGWNTLSGNQTYLKRLYTHNASAVTALDYPNLAHAESLTPCATSVVAMSFPALLSVTFLQIWNCPLLRSFSAPLATVTETASSCANPVLSIFCIGRLTGSGASFGTSPRLSRTAILAFLAGAPNVTDYSQVCPSPGDCGDDYVGPDLCTEPTYQAITAPGGGGEGTLNGGPCPEGGVCPGNNKVYPKPGYWNSGGDSGFVHECEEPAALRCLGGTNSSCGDGYGGVLCGVCATGFYARGSECVPCASDQKGAEAALYATNAVLFLLFGAGHVTLDDHRLDYLVTFFKWLQLLRVAGTKTGYNLPTGMKEINDNLALITFDYNFLRPSCDGSQAADFNRIFWGNAVVIVCLLAPPLLVLVPLAIFHVKKRAFWINRISRTLIVMTILIYFVVATRAIQSTTCIQLGSVKVLKAYTDFPCEGSAVLGVGILALITFVTAVPIVFLVTVIQLYRRGKLEDDGLTSRFGYMYHKLRVNKGRFTFEVVQMFHLLLMAIAWNVFPYNASPYAFAVATYGVLLMVVAVWRPLASARLNAIRVLSVGMGFVSAVANLVTLSALNNSAGTSIGVVVAMGIVVILLTAGVYLVDRRLVPEEMNKSNKAKGEKENGMNTLSNSKPGSASSSGSKSSSKPSGSASSAE